jgi:exonuclease III
MDVHPRPRPSPFFKFMHWNLNSIPAHDFERIPILEAFAVQEKFNLICITESALKNKVSNEKIAIDGYSILRCDLPNNDRCGGVLLYYKNDLSVKNRLDLCNISNTIVAEISISRKNIFLLFLIENLANLLKNFPPIVTNWTIFLKK